MSHYGKEREALRESPQWPENSTRINIIGTNGNTGIIMDKLIAMQFLEIPTLKSATLQRAREKKQSPHYRHKTREMYLDQKRRRNGKSSI